MNRERFRRREPALGIHRHHVVEQRDGLVGKPHPGCPEPAERVRKSCATVSSRSARGSPWSMPSRSPESGAGSRAGENLPAITVSALAQSATLRAIGPIESSV